MSHLQICFITLRYVSYRLAATIQILLYLSILVYVFDCTLDPLCLAGMAI